MYLNFLFYSSIFFLTIIFVINGCFFLTPFYLPSNLNTDVYLPFIFIIPCYISATMYLTPFTLRFYSSSFSCICFFFLTPFCESSNTYVYLPFIYYYNILIVPNVFNSPQSSILFFISFIISFVISSSSSPRLFIL